MIDVVEEIRNAARGILPTARRCEDESDLAFWFWCVAKALRSARDSDEAVSARSAPVVVVTTYRVIEIDWPFIPPHTTRIRVVVEPRK